MHLFLVKCPSRDLSVLLHRGSRWPRLSLKPLALHDLAIWFNRFSSIRHMSWEYSICPSHRDIIKATGWGRGWQTLTSYSISIVTEDGWELLPTMPPTAIWGKQEKNDTTITNRKLRDRLFFVSILFAPSLCSVEASKWGGFWLGMFDLGSFSPKHDHRCSFLRLPLEFVVLLFFFTKHPSTPSVFHNNIHKSKRKATIFCFCATNDSRSTSTSVTLSPYLLIHVVCFEG